MGNLASALVSERAGRFLPVQMLGDEEFTPREIRLAASELIARREDDIARSLLQLGARLYPEDPWLQIFSILTHAKRGDWASAELTLKLGVSSCGAVSVEPILLACCRALRALGRGSDALRLARLCLSHVGDSLHLRAELTEIAQSLLSLD